MTATQMDSTPRLKASIGRWATRQAWKLRAAYRSQQLAIQLASVTLMDLFILYVTPAPADVMILIGVQLALVALIRGESALNAQLQGSLRDEIGQRREERHEDGYRLMMALARAEQAEARLTELKAQMDTVAKAADTAWLESRLVPTGRREQLPQPVQGVS